MWGREKDPINKIINEKGDFTKQTAEIQRHVETPINVTISEFLESSM